MHYVERRGRNEITRLLNGQGLHISEGSVGNIIRAYHTEHTEYGNSDIQSLQPGVVPNSEVLTSPQVPGASISTGINKNDTGSPSPMAKVHSGLGQANNVNSVTHANGGPLLHFLSENNDMDRFAFSIWIDSNRTTITTDKEDVIPPVPAMSVLSIPPKLNPSRDLFIKDPETKIFEQVNIEPDANVRLWY